MKHEIEFSRDAERQLKQFKARDQRIIVAAIEEQLLDQPTTPTKNRKELREFPIARWELRVQEFRVFYNVLDDPPLVIVKAIGVKEGNKFVIEGEEFP